MSQLKMIPLDKIRENPVALRSVNRQTEAYLGLVDSIRTHGVLNPINVREVQGSNGDTVYGLIDGLQRYTASGDAGLKEIPAQVVEKSDAEVLEAQIIANIHKIETKPVEYSKQLVRILTQNPTMSKLQLAKKLSKSEKWLDDRLGLTKLSEQIGKLVDEEKVNLSNAYVLAKLPPEEQMNFVERAMTESPTQFLPAVQNRIKEIRDAKRQGKTPGPAEFQPHATIRKMSELKQEMENQSLGPVLIKQNNVKTVEEAFNLAIQWVLNMDPTSRELQKQADEKRKGDEKARKEERKKERLEQQAREAADKVAELKASGATV